MIPVLVITSIAYNTDAAATHADTGPTTGDEHADTLHGARTMHVGARAAAIRTTLERSKRISSGAHGTQMLVMRRSALHAAAKLGKM